MSPHPPAAASRRHRRRAGLWRGALAGALLGLLLGLALMPLWVRGAGPAVQVLDVYELGAGGGIGIREWSALAWDEHHGVLYAASDRGELSRWRVELEQGRIAVLAPLAQRRLAGRPNAESLVLRRRAGGGIELLLADETAHTVRVLDGDGAEHGTLALPGALADRSRLAEPNRGVEAIAWHEQHGLLAAPQSPLRGEPAGVHRIHAERTSFAFRAAFGRSTIKAIERLDAGRLLVLEKLPASLAAGRPSRVLLREIDLAACPGSAPCDPALEYVGAGVLASDDNAEGLACLSAELCLLATDGGPRGRTRLLLVQRLRP